MSGERKDTMVIERKIIGEKAGSVFGTLRIILTEEELEEAYNLYKHLKEEEMKEAQEIER